MARVLLAEDNLVNQKVAKRLLEKAGCRVDVAANGLEAVNLWAKCRYDVIFMDVQMPEMDGCAATSEIRRIEAGQQAVRHTPIVALTANTMAGDQQRCAESGMDDFIPKPIPFEKLKQTLQRWVRPKVNGEGQATAEEAQVELPVA
jgi:CheY-like chemotaxis protein